ncbi:3-oxoacyl-[acyl-carrier protein] reductase [hydrothermal vent metagenome]|uniref:3-oxoacyl-[acyl-carrier protein] reductase n=1 Tax=hydrothermal vent metagenome TaxID=652676 RepID=A0A3B0ZY66_9ZZZZ
MNHVANKNVLVTGGSKGIGLAVANEFARNGHNVILVARHKNELEQAADSIENQYAVTVKIIAIDLARQESPQQLFQQLAEENICVDILINNAGVGMTGNFADNTLADVSRMLQLNMVSLTNLTHLFLQPMLGRQQGHIINVGSIVACFPGAPNWASYVASKHYVRAFSRGLARELKNTGVTITLLSPGTTMTDFVETADATTMRAYRTPHTVSVEKIAQLAYAGYQKGRFSVIPGMFNRLLAVLGELPPRVIAFEVFAFLSQKITQAR